MQELKSLIVSRRSFDSPEAYDIINSNITVVNLLRCEGYPDIMIPTVAIQSYWVDFYRAQMVNGGFAQFVFNSRWNPDIVAAVNDGLAKMANPAHVAYWKARAAVVESLPSRDLATFIAGPFFGDPLVPELDDSAFFDVHRDQNLVEANSAFLRAAPSLQPLSIEDMYTALEVAVGRPIER